MLVRLLLLLTIVFALPDNVLCDELIRERIGVSIPLTGEASTYGNDFRNIYSFANEFLAQSHYKLLFEDDKCLSRSGVSIAHKFSSVDRVKYVIGVPCDGVFSSTAPIYERNKIIVITPSGSRIVGDSLFHSTLSNESWTLPLLEYLRGTKGQIGLYREETGFAEEFVQNFKRLSPKYGLDVVSKSFTSEATDFVAPILSFKKQQVAGLVLVTQTEASLVRIVEQVRRINFDIPLFNIFLAGSPSFLKLVGSKADGITFVDLPSLKESLTTDGRKIYEQFKEKYGPLVSGEAVFILAFEGFRALHEAIQSGENARSFLRKANFDGIAGEWYFGKDGFWIGPKTLMKRIENGKVVKLSGSNK